MNADGAAADVSLSVLGTNGRQIEMHSPPEGRLGRLLLLRNLLRLLLLFVLAPFFFRLASFRLPALFLGQLAAGLDLDLLRRDRWRTLRRMLDWRDRRPVHRPRRRGGLIDDEEKHPHRRGEQTAARHEIGFPHDLPLPMPPHGAPGEV
jgi:hypothetical protein